MNKVVEAALDIAGGTEIGKQVKDLQGNVMDTIGLKAETKEALQEANLDQVATTYEALAAKVGIATDQKEIITNFIAKGRDKDKFVELHTKIKSLAQQGGVEDVSKLDEVLATHELTGGSTMGFTIANALGKVWGFARKAMEKLNLIHSPKDLGKIVFAINEITAKIDVSKLDSQGEEDEEFNEGEHIRVDGKELLGTDVSKEAKHFVDYAETYEDEDYIWGGNGKKGIDCSGLITQCLKKGGISIQRTAATQFLDDRLKERSLNEAMLGDFIFFKNKKKHRKGVITHVGIIKGRLKNGDIVMYDASRNGDKVETRVVKPQSNDYEFFVKNTSKLFKDLKIEDMAYNEHTGESVDGEIQTV